MNASGIDSVRSHWRADLSASLVVFLVALPLCMGIAVASGAPAAAGLVTGIVAGIVVGAVAGSPLQVSGPAAGLTVLVFEVVGKYGIETLGVVVAAAGLLQLITGFARLGQWFRAVSPAVVEGMLAGIGVLIIASQMHVMTDAQPLAKGWQNLKKIPESLGMGLSSPNQAWALGCGVATLALIYLWNWGPRRRWRQVPAALVAVGTVATAAALLHAPVQHVDVPANLLAALHQPTLDDWRKLLSVELWTTVAAIAAVASAESLLCAAAVDKIHNGPRTDFDRELAAQGLGNLLCGMLGAIPMTGVIVRSAANVHAGAKSRLSAVFHGVWILLLVLALPWLLRSIPTACLAAVLVHTGLQLVRPSTLKHLWHLGPAEALIYLITACGVVGVDLLTGVAVGFALSVARLARSFSRLKVQMEMRSDGGVDLALSGAATFLQLPRLAARLAEVPPGANVRLDLSRLRHVDHACFELLEGWERQQSGSDGTVEFAGPTPRDLFRGGA